MSKYLEFKEVVATGKTKRFQINSKSSGEILAYIKWYGAWRQYTFQPCKDTIWNPACLEDVQFFIKREMGKRKKNRMGYCSVCNGIHSGKNCNGGELSFYID